MLCVVVRAPFTYPTPVTVDFNTRFAVWTRGSVYSVPGSDSGQATPRLFNVTATLRINQQPVLYTPSVSEVLQAGWGKVQVAPLVHCTKGRVNHDAGKSGKQMRRKAVHHDQQYVTAP